MELGKGQWSDRIADLEGLRQRYFKHMEAYDRVLSLGKLKVKSDNISSYELVESPKKTSS